MKIYGIGHLKRLFNISEQSVRNWEKQGLISKAHRTPGGHRRFTKTHIEELSKLIGVPDGKRKD